LLDQGVQECTIFLNEKYEQLSTDYEKHHLVVIDMRSQISGTYTAFISLTIPRMTNLLLLLQRRLYYTFIVSERINI
jgi:hypothetical protein